MSSTNLVAQASAIVLAAVSSRELTWQGDPLPGDALADPQGCLPLLAAHACSVMQTLGIAPPALTMSRDIDASFDLRLEAVEANEHGIGAFLLTLRDTALHCEPALELLIPSLEEYIDANPHHIKEQSPGKEIG